ncbi:cytochrome P450 [Nucisporomicrobium flavum]|uniref:cytochrome P450 n=1 Tax=Nucisporomicrobium flavum TaxID=2785915 RepID=UPI001F466ABF|nr:cytochrome P450 [Nucisporomicrobium flavum]
MTLTRRPTIRAPRAWPLLGHAWPLLRDPLRFVQSLPAYGDVVWIRLGPARAALVCDPQLTSAVLLDDRTFDKGGLLVERGREVVGNGVGTCPHDEHQRQRRLARPAFHPARLPHYAEGMRRQIATVLGRWRDGREIDVLDEMLTLTGGTVVEAMFAATSLPPRTLATALDDFATVLAGIYRRMFLPAPLDRVPLPGNLRYRAARNRLRRTVGDLVADYRRTGTDRGDILSVLVGSDGPGFTDDEIHDQVVTLFLAGTESAASVLAWALHVLGERPDLEDRLHREVDALSGDLPGPGDLPSLDLTGRIVTETLRVYPPGWLFTRRTTAATRLGEHDIPAGTTVAFSPYLMHHRADLFDDPERFDPDRWDGTSAGPPARGVFIPFGAGARKCLGDTFAMTEATLALAAITRRWRLRPVPGRPVRRTVDTTLRPRGLRMRLEAR